MTFPQCNLTTLSQKKAGLTCTRTDLCLMTWNQVCSCFPCRPQLSRPSRLCAEVVPDSSPVVGFAIAFQPLLNGLLVCQISCRKDQGWRSWRSVFTGSTEKSCSLSSFLCNAQLQCTDCVCEPEVVCHLRTSCHHSLLDGVVAIW